MEGFEAGGLSPDGRQLAFEWNGEAMDNRDIYVKFVASPDTHRLTTDPATDIAPQWSRSNRA
jgi:Tol biopolymer transport system component